MNTFENLKLSSQLYDTIKNLGFTMPTEIQAKAIPLILEGKDVVGESATGSGKTLAFGTGIIDKVVPGEGLQALVLTPTRELAEQVKNYMVNLGRKKGIKAISIYGGVGMEPQISGLRRSEIVVATPGRFLDHLRQRTVDTSKIKVLVLDEADRMFDMGFLDDVEKIIKVVPEKRQTMFFSATISLEMEKLIYKYMNNPEYVSAIKQVDASKLTQVYYNVEKNMKLSLLAHLLKEEKSGLVIVFSNTRRNTDFIVKNLMRNNIDAMAIHGGLTQNKRTKTLENFNNAKVSVLVCTDIAARGLHIDDVSHVYNYDMPNDARDYVHRIGRTARAGKDGKVINLICKFDYDAFSDIRKRYPEFKIDEAECPEFERLDIRVEERDRGRGRAFRGGRGSWDKSEERKDRGYGRRESSDGNDRRRSSGGRSFGGRGRSSSGRSRDGFRGSRGGRSSSGRRRSSHGRR